MRSAFGAGSTALAVVDGIDLSGKRAVITGASSGLGVETARALAQAGAEVILPVRNAKKGEEAAERIRALAGNSAVRVAAMDLSCFDSVRRFAAELCAEGAPVHMLINNAGIMASPLARNERGHEGQFATNHLGHFLLTSLLLPLLKKGAPARVVALSSVGHRLSPIVFEDIHFQQRPYDKWLAYGQSKTANALFAVELNRRFAPSIEAFAVHPGGIMTQLQRDLSEAEMRALGWLDEAGSPRRGFKTPEQGAATATWAATAPELAGQGGAYLEDCARAAPADSGNRLAGVHGHALDPEAAARLWELSEQMVDVRVAT